jgi:hypothetical protein
MSPKEEVCVIDTAGEAGTVVLNHVEYNDTEKHSAVEKALDLAIHIFNSDHAYQYTEKEANAVKWKIDRHVMPVLFLTGMISSTFVRLRMHTKARAKRATGEGGGWPPRKKARCSDLHMTS